MIFLHCGRPDELLHGRQAWLNGCSSEDDGAVSCLIYTATACIGSSVRSLTSSLEIGGMPLAACHTILYFFTEDETTHCAYHCRDLLRLKLLISRREILQDGESRPERTV
jgi:hypothetical protein